MVPGCVQYVQLINVPPDAVEFPVEVLDGGGVMILKPPAEEPGHDARFPHFSGAQNDHPEAVLLRDVQLLPRGRARFLYHDLLALSLN